MDGKDFDTRSVASERSSASQRVDVAGEALKLASASSEICQICSSNRAAFFCGQCEIRFCPSCDTKQHVGPLSKHRRVPISAEAAASVSSSKKSCSVHPSEPQTEYDEFCRTFICRKCVAAPQHAGHFAGKVNSNDVLQRQKRILLEQLSQLKQKVGTGVGFTKQKLVKGMDTQLGQLVNGRLHEAFTDLNQYVNTVEERLGTSVRQYKAHFEPRINEAVRTVQSEFDRDNELIAEAEKALQQGDAYLLEGTAVTRLLHQMHNANKRDPLTQIRTLESRVDLSSHKVFKLDGVRRSVDRMFVAPPTDLSALAAKGGFQLQDSEARLDLKRVEFGAVYGLSWQKVSERWEKKYGSEASIDDDEQLRAFVKIIVPQLVNDHPLLDEYVRTLFSKYPDASSARKLQEAVVDALKDAFEDLVGRLEEVADELRQRARSHEDPHALNKHMLCSVWAAMIEKRVEVAVREMVADQELRAAHEWSRGAPKQEEEEDEPEETL